jgi:hypothetical protein
LAPGNKALGAVSQRVLRRFTYDAIAHSKPVMEFVISMVGADRVMADAGVALLTTLGRFGLSPLASPLFLCHL